MLLDLYTRIGDEVEDIERTVQLTLEADEGARHFPDQQVHFLNSLALNLHSFYNGLERIFETISRRLDPTFPSGERWHRNLLEQMGEEMNFGGREIRWGVAMADAPEGPYRKSPYNPVTNSGHEVCVWPYKGGIAALLTTDGPEKNTIQYASDGINFEIMAVLKGTPEALGLFRSQHPDTHPLEGIGWGLCHVYKDGWQYIRRFETYLPKAQ